jgi:hypothetical protein
MKATKTMSKPVTATVLLKPEQTDIWSSTGIRDLPAMNSQVASKKALPGLA